MRQTKLRVIITTLLMSIFFAVNGFGATPVFATGTKTVTTPPSATKADLVANDPSYTSSIECSALKTKLEGYGSLYPFTSWPYGTLNQFKVDGAPPTTWTDYTNISNAPVSSPKISIKRTSNSIEWTSNFGIDFVLLKGGTNGTNIYIYVPSGNSGGSLTTPGAQGISHVTFCWDNPAKIKIDKSTSPNAYDNVDFDFTLKIPNYLKDGSSFTENFELSDSDGIKTFTDLPKGNFDLNEILTSYEDSQLATSVVCTLKRNGSTSTIINSNEDETIDLDGVLGGDEISCTFTNTLPTRSIKFVKKEYGTNALLNGWTIKVLNSDGTPFLDANGNPVQGVTGANGNGTVIISGLPFGTYKYCEVLQSGWAIHSPSGGCYTDTIDSNTGTGTTTTATESIGTQTYGGSGIDTFYFYNKKAVRSIRFIKKEYGTYTYLNGWKIQVKDQAGTVIKEGTTGEDGTGIVIIDDIPFGTYTYCEVLQSGWAVHSPTGGCFTDTIDSSTPTGTSATATDNLYTQTYGGDGIETYYFFNKKAVGSLKVTKSVVWNGITPNTGQTFEICITGPSYSSPNCKTFDYDGGDQTWTNLLPGTYTVTETSPGANWTVSGSGVTVSVVADQTATKTVTNTHKLGSLKVTKSVNWNGVTPDTGKTFEICITGPSYPTTPSCKTYTHNGGDQTWTNLIPGTYTVTETNPGSTWTLSGSGVTVSVVADQTASKTVTNTHNVGSLKVTKSVVWNGVTPDTGKTFEICITGPSYPTTPNCKTFDYDGGFEIWSNLIPGTYTVSETDPGSNEWKVPVIGGSSNVVSGQTAYATVKNERKIPGIDIKKYTNGYDADAANGSLGIVPKIAPNATVTWTYIVSNTGSVSFPKASVVVTDNLKDIPVANSVVPVYVSELFGNGDANFDPGERLLYRAVGTALDLVAQGSKSYIVNGCQTGQGINRPTYENYGYVKITGTQYVDHDPSHYCNPENPGIDITKFTNGYNANAADGSQGEVPKVPAGQGVTWTYLVTNTGNVPFLKASVVVTDNRGVAVTFDKVVSPLGSDDAVMSPGEVWQFKATGNAVDLVLNSGAAYVVNGCQTGQGIGRPTYNNTGFVKITGYSAEDNDPSHYCNPEGPGIDITKFTNGYNANAADGSQGEVPKIPAGQGVTWTYLVTNTGNVPFPAASVVVTDNRGVAVTFEKVVVGSGPDTLNPGDTWQFKATGNAVDLVLNSGEAYVVNGCQTGQGIARPTYNNTGFVKITGYSAEDNDPSHYCNPENPNLEIKKYTNGFDADDPNGSDVPRIEPDGSIEWTYVVSNTGNVPYDFDDVDVTDDQGVVPAFVGYLAGDTDDIFEPGERWLYKASGTAVKLELNPQEGIVEGCRVQETITRPTYNNTGMVSVENGPSDSDESHYCNPYKPGIFIKKYTNGFDADTPTGPVVAVGSTVTWTYYVTNTGDVPLSNVVVTDNIAGVTPVYIEGDTNGDQKLDLTEKWLFRTTGIAVAGQYANVGTTKGTPPEGKDVTDDDPSHYFANDPTVAALGDRVWHDLNMNGLQDQGEPGVPNVTVNLLAGDCTTPMGKTDVTDSNGIYGFGQLVPGDYCVEFDLTTLPTGFSVTTQNANSNGSDASDSDGDPTTGKTQSVNLPGGTENLTLDLGIYKPAALGDRVWYDQNANGVQDQGEPGVPNVKVNLLAGDCSTSMNQSTTTNGDGIYGFIDLTPGSYCVQFDLTTLPDNYSVTQKDAGNDEQDSDADPSTGKTAPVTLQSGDNNLTLDAGIIERSLQVVATPLCEKDAPYVQYTVTPINFTPGNNPVTIRWIDVDNDAILYEFTGQPLANKVLWPEAGVDGSGVGNKWPGWSFVDGSWVDGGSNLRPQIKIEFSVNPSESVTVEYPPATPTCTPAPRASLGNRVWEDTNKNGVQDNGEANVPGVKVTLYTCADVQVGQPLVTDENGNYLFTNLMPGSYYVTFDPTTLPPGFTFTTPNGNGVSDDLDSDADATTGKTACVTLEDGDNYVDLDAGIVAPNQPALAALGDTVWYDVDKDGIQDGGEAGVPGVKVDLYKSDGTFVATQNTTASGKYLFNDLQPGSYYVEFATVQGYVYTRYNVNANGQDALDSDPPMPWLDVTIDDGGDPAVKTKPLTYTFFYTNTDPTLAATNVVISTTIPAGTTFNPAASNAGWSCPNNAAGTVCTLTIATLNGNASGSAAFTVIVDENAPNVPLDIFTTVTQSTLARTQVVTLAAGQTNLTLDAGLVVIGSSLTTPTPTDPTNIPGGEQPNQRKSIFLPTVQYQQ